MTVTLVVDDDDFMRVLTSTLLMQLGLSTPLQASDGEAALAMMAEQAVDLIVCDLNMPGMDGVSLLRHLAAVEHPPAVVLFSGEDRRVLGTALQLAAAHHLLVLGSMTKPPTLEALEPMIEEHRRRAQPRRGAVADSGASPECLTPEAIAEGLELGRLAMAFQPQVSVADRTVVGVEALARWDDPKRGLLGPWAFIPVAERHGLMPRVTLRALELSIQQAAVWAAAGEQFTVSVNVTVDDLGDVAFADMVIDLLQHHGVAPERLVLEVTESKVMGELAAPLEVLARLRLRRIGLALDDYGTGASSMQQLARIPFTELKIDRHFVSNAPSDPDARAMLESAVELADRLQLRCLAEGVETEQQWDLVAELGCDRVQGYLIAPPLPANRLAIWLAAWRAEHTPVR